MYTKQTWADGDVLLASKLNHIEDGVAEVCVQDPGLYIGGYLGVVWDYDNPNIVSGIPQQTVQITSNQTRPPLTTTFTSADLNKFSKNETQFTVTVNGTQCDASWYSYGNEIIARDNSTFQDKYYLVWDGNFSPVGFSFAEVNNTLGSYTVSCQMIYPGVKWGIVQDSSSGGGGIA